MNHASRYSNTAGYVIEIQGGYKYYDRENGLGTVLKQGFLNFQDSDAMYKAQAFYRAFLSILRHERKIYTTGFVSCLIGPHESPEEVSAIHALTSGIHPVILHFHSQKPQVARPYPVFFRKNKGRQPIACRRIINPKVMKNNKVFAAAFFALVAGVMFGGSVFGQGNYLGPSSITNPSHEKQFNEIVTGTSIDTIAITAPQATPRNQSSLVYLLADGDQGSRVTELDAREQVYLVEDFISQRIAVRFAAFHTGLVEVKIYNEDRKLIFWKKGYEVFSGEQIVINYQDFEGGKYFLHVNTNDGTVIKQHLYKTYQYYTVAE